MEKFLFILFQQIWPTSVHVSEFILVNCLMHEPAHFIRITLLYTHVNNEMEIVFNQNVENEDGAK